MKNMTILLTITVLLLTFKGFSQLKSYDTLQRSMDIPGVPDGITILIDGKSDEGFWDMIPFQECKRDIYNAWMIADLDSVRSTATMHLKFKCAYDANNLYFYADVTDDALVSWSQVKDQTFVNNDGTTGITQPYWCDNIELYTLFAPATYAEGWGLTYASQLRMWPDLSPTPFIDNITGGGWSHFIEDPGAKGYVTSTAKTSTGYTFEARIPFAVILPPDEEIIAVKPVAGNTIQFDIYVFDRDLINIGTSENETGGRQCTAIHSWNSRWNRNWGYTDYYGSATFKDKIINTGLTKNNASPVKVYPTLCNNSITINNLTAAKKSSSIRICNIAGQNIISQMANSTSVAINTTNFESGLYIVYVDGKPVSKIIKQ